MNRNISDPVVSINAATSMSRPLVMKCGGSAGGCGGSLHSLSSSATIAALSRSDSDIEDIDKSDGEEDEETVVQQDLPPRILSNRPPISSPESSGQSRRSSSLYETPASSLYESPISSPSYYATPMERSPWASPRTSLKSVPSPLHSPGKTSSPFLSPQESVTSPPPPSQSESSQTSESAFLAVPQNSGGGVNNSGGHRRSQSLKLRSGRRLVASQAFDAG